MDCSKGSGCYISGAWNLLLTIAQTYSLFLLTARFAYPSSESSFFSHDAFGALNA